MKNLSQQRRMGRLGVVVLIALLGLFFVGTSLSASSTDPLLKGITNQPSSQYIVLAWNDLGMHCYNRSFKDLAVLPPYNTLWAQVIKIGDPPQIITAGITVNFSFPDNTYSAADNAHPVAKSDFWDYDLQLFGVDLPPNIGLTGTGLSGKMALQGDHFEATGIPLTEFSDSAPTVPDPYQLATIVVSDTVSGAELTSAQVVAPVSTEMHCDYCHYDNGPGNEDIATGVVEQNILSKHDDENNGSYPPGHPGPLMNRRPILCAECHSSNALGAPGVPGIPSLSNAMHEEHDGKVSDSLAGCYSCHPGPQTICLRDVMSQSASKIYCVDCHGTMYQVSRNQNPWLNEPRCDNANCHGSAYSQDKPLYRMSKEHGGVYCEGCHDSTHAIAPSGEPRDSIKFVALQGHEGTLNKCTVCHTAWPSQAGPHQAIYNPPKIYFPWIIK